MRLSLECHKDTPSIAVSQIDVDIDRASPGGLSLHYLLSGDLSSVCVPAPRAPGRTDGLWQKTCFEAFVRPWDGAGYVELNFSPSTEWAAYRFRDYRDGMKPAGPFEPRILTNLEKNGLHIVAEVDLGALQDFPDLATWQVGLSAVVEETTGNKSYWALAHPRGKPDFHHADCFVHELKPNGSQ